MKKKVEYLEGENCPKCGKPKYDWIETEDTECDVILEDNAKDRA